MNITSETRSHEGPRVIVLLATYNGLRFIAAQVESLLAQEACAVEILVSDDHSVDGTWDWLQDMARTEVRMKLLPRAARCGNAARNFYRLLRDVDLSRYDYVAFADQDDFWFTWKLARSITRICEGGYAAASSDVIALWPDGRQALIRKSQPQRRLDFLFESAGQGCTYLLSQACAAGFQRFLAAHWQDVNEVSFHDWMLYAWCRGQGLPWHIEPAATMLYRQHAGNVQGANSGWAALNARLVMVRSGWYGREIIKIATLIQQLPAFTPECAEVVSWVTRRTLPSRLRLSLRVGEMRRRFKDRMLLRAACLLGLM